MLYNTSFENLANHKLFSFFGIIQKNNTIADVRKELLSSGLYYKQVTIVIYDRNDIGLYYKTRDNRN